MNTLARIIRFFFILAVFTKLKEAIDFEAIVGEVTCKKLKRAYKGEWYEPECNDDGTFQNPQCFHNGVKLCCCTNNASANKTVAWLGDCIYHHSSKLPLPTCNEGVMTWDGISPRGNTTQSEGETAQS